MLSIVKMGSKTKGDVVIWPTVIKEWKQKLNKCFLMCFFFFYDIVGREKHFFFFLS